MTQSGEGWNPGTLTACFGAGPGRHLCLARLCYKASVSRPWRGVPNCKEVNKEHQTT